MDISKADIIVSMAGRDKGGLFYVLRVENGYAFLANGKQRTMENPKRKKLKHLRFAPLGLILTLPRRFFKATKYSTASYAGIWPFMVRH